MESAGKSDVATRDEERDRAQVPADALPTKSNREILASTVAAGVNELRRPAGGLFFSGLAGGLEVGFGVVLMAVFATLAPGAAETPTGRLVMGALYSFGFIVVVVGRSELFTEHTSMVVFPVLNGDEGVGTLMRTWGIVYGANVLGTVLFAYGCYLVLPALGSASHEAFAAIGARLLEHSVAVIFGSAVLAGWLMGLVAWLVAAARDTISQVLLVGLVTFAIGFASLHHCIAGSVEALGAVFGGGASVGDYLRFLVTASVGNALGGVLMVAAMRFGHATRTA